jgi:endonuclease-3 related protein
LGKLRSAKGLSLAAVRTLTEAELADLIRPAGFYRQKARTIRKFLDWLEKDCRGSLRRLFAQPPDSVRAGLLRIRGIGPETADAILLYAANQPYFVADTYTRRVLSRHGLIRPEASYGEAQAFLHAHLKRNSRVYNEFHALLVETAKRHCVKSAPKCCDCPLESFLEPPQAPV